MKNIVGRNRRGVTSFANADGGAIRNSYGLIFFMDMKC
jgi:hypothetical protein